MKVNIDYSKSPAKQFDAVEDVKNYFGKRYDNIAAQMKEVTDARQFTIYCNFAGIEGYPIVAWYDHFHGQGAYEKAPWTEVA